MQNLSIVNPANGEEWFQILWKLPFENERFKITIENLYSISSAACSQDLKLTKLRMLGTDENFHQSYGMPLGDYYYIPWLAKEVWMDQVRRMHQDFCSRYWILLMEQVRYFCLRMFTYNCILGTL